VRFIAIRDDFFEMGFLGFDNLVGRVPMEREATWAAICLHVIVFMR
jgi:hypothetical protein